MVEQNQVVQRVRSRNADNPTNARRNEEISTVVCLYIVLIKFCILLVRIYDVHQQSCEHFDYYKLKDILFATISKVLGFFPVCQLIRFLAITKWPEVMNLLLVLNHDSIDLFVLHKILNR